MIWDPGGRGKIFGISGERMACDTFRLSREHADYGITRFLYIYCFGLLGSSILGKLKGWN